MTNARHLAVIIAIIGLLWAVFASVATGADITAYYDFEGSGADRFDDPAGSFADDLIGQYKPAFSNVVSTNAKGSSQSASFDSDSALFTDGSPSSL